MTDVEVDGPIPGSNSMRSVGAVALGEFGGEYGTFEAVLEPLPNATPDPATYAWFQTHPGAWAAATSDPEPVTDVLVRFCEWIRSLPGRRAFAAAPMSFDGCWLDYYLRRFTRYSLVQGPYNDNHLFDGPGLCIRSFAAAVTARPVGDLVPSSMPAQWFGGIEHSHRALDDARGFAHLLRMLLQMSRDAVHK